MRILIKLPSRERPRHLLTAVRAYSRLCEDPARARMLVTLDVDDLSLAESQANEMWRLCVPVTFNTGLRHTKIEAVNRGLPGPQPWDILIVASDDMWPVVSGYDRIIREAMAASFPDTDGCLWFGDGRQERLCTLPIIGRKYFERTGRVYQQGYSSYYADDEQTEVAMALGRMARFEQCLIRHEHPHHQGKVQDDALYRHNRTHKDHDRAHYLLRKAAGFP